MAHVYLVFFVLTNLAFSGSIIHELQDMYEYISKGKGDSHT
jgi:hypothetical protein